LGGEDVSCRGIAKNLKLSVGAVYYICCNQKENCKKRGRKFKITSKTARKVKRSLQKMVNNNEKITARKIIEGECIKVSKRTMQRHLKAQSLKYGAIKKQIILSEKHKTDREEICKSWLKDRINFSSVIMSDEKKFNLDGPDGWFSYYPVSGKRQTRQRNQQGGGGILVSGWIFSDGTFHAEYLTSSLNSDAYITLLRDKILPIIRRKVGSHFILQQDNAPAHVAKVTMEYLKNERIKTLTWPARSPDLNITENVWALLVEEVYNGERICNVSQLRDRIADAILKGKKPFPT